ncbi:hypothetical protein [uncultured Limosilactobacillus sp.]|uniref:hypothetical protein n=1 Tax=uncultured Limosilactobacillus sp. TaxID=2837629 RepID=UPI0025F0B4EE|nr:hypothetical protein [uncultured Limosilactobacillus sp.]
MLDEGSNDCWALLYGQITIPLRVWYRNRDYYHQRSDFRWVEVFVELDISEEKVILSNFEAGHFGLNNFYYSSETNDEEWE